jgi:hypothetical protein
MSDTIARHILDLETIENDLISRGYVERLPNGSMQITPHGAVAMGVLIACSDAPDDVLHRAADAARETLWARGQAILVKDKGVEI